MEKKYYDLTPSQKVLFYAQKYTLHKQVNNINISLLLDEEIDFAVMEEAIKIAYERHDCLRIRLNKIDGEPKQYFRNIEEPIIEYLDFKGKTFEEMEKKLYKIARKPITKYDKLLSKVYLINSYDGRTGIYFAVSHLIMDSWAISMFFKDLYSVYQALKDGAEMPKPIPSYEELIKAESNYRDTEQYKKDRDYFEVFFKELDEPILTHVNGPSLLEKYRKKKKNPNLRYAQAMGLRSKSNNVCLPVSKDLLNRMEEYCQENRIPMQTLILFAYRSYLSKVNNREKTIYLNTVMARRATLKEKKAGGSRLHFFPFITTIEEDHSFEEGCIIIHGKQNELFRHVNIDPLEVMAIWRKAYGVGQIGEYGTMAVTFQPVKLELEKGVGCDSKWYGNGATSQNIYPTVMDGGKDGGLKIYYEHLAHRINNDTVERLHQYVVSFLEKGTENKDITVGELLNLED